MKKKKLKKFVKYPIFILVLLFIGILAYKIYSSQVSLKGDKSDKDKDKLKAQIQEKLN